ncbi:MAG: tRNA pseudouridine(55) synthase TruB, partial [Bacteroidia bacterium]
YIRSLARDLGLALQSGAHLRALRRTRIGEFWVKDAITPAVFGEIIAELEASKPADKDAK